MKKVSLLLFAAIWILAAIPNASAMDFTVINISNEPVGFSDGSPQISDSGQVVWARMDLYMPFQEIAYYDCSGVSIISGYPGSSDYGQQINANGQMVWGGITGGEHDFDNEIFYYDGITINISNNPDGHDFNPQINANGHVVWSGSNGSDNEIYYYDTSSVSNISNSPAISDGEPQINANGHVVWSGSDGSDSEIYYYDGSIVSNISNSASVSDTKPQINANGQVVWLGLNGSVYDIYYYDGSMVSNISNGTAFSYSRPRINANGHVVWSGRNISDREIYYYDGSTAFNISNNPAGGDVAPQINDNGHVVWAGSNGSVSEIHYYDGSTASIIPNNTVEDSSPHINASGQVVWSGKVLMPSGLKNPEIFLATPSPMPKKTYASKIITPEIQITDTPSPYYELTPTMGADAVSDVVVYTTRELLPTGFGPGDIYAQRLSETGPIGDPILVSTSGTDNQFNDISGTLIVYTAFEEVGSSVGQIRQYNLATGETTNFTDSIPIRGARVHGTRVAWVEGVLGDTQVKLFDPAMFPEPIVISDGNNFTPGDLAIGDTFVVWNQSSGGQKDVVAYDMRNGQLVTVASNPDRNEQYASTSGSWIVWEESAEEGMDIMAKNMDTGETLVVIADGNFNRVPTIDGDLITYESDAAGNYDIYLYCLSSKETFQITDNLSDQRMNNVYGNMVAYMDNRNGEYDIFISTFKFNSSPEANAGPDQSVHVGDIVTLDGSSSSDPDGDYPLTYAWAVVCQPGCAVALSDPNLVNPTFSANCFGNYRIQLSVTDSEGIPSEPDEVIVSTFNTAPVADAGPDQAIIEIGTTVQLDGTQSYDDDGDPITYSWVIVSKPSGSSAALSDSTSPSPSFIADVNGVYVIQLAVSDPWTSSDPDTVSISFSNVKPVANAGVNQSVSRGDTVCLDGSNSSDANLDPLTYIWSIVSKPDGSMAVLDNPGAIVPCFIADMSGSYILSLVVNDGFENSDPSNITVIAIEDQNVVTEELEEIIITINGLDDAVLKNGNMKNALTNKINNVLEMIDQGLYQDALDKLENDILKKTNGCAETGSPDKNDWIKDCDAQGQVYPVIIEAIELLEDLI